MEGRYYVVKQGDSLWGIAREFKCTVDQLAAHNGLTGKHKNIIKIGQKLYLPEQGQEPDLRLHTRVIGLSSKPVKHAKLKLTHDGKTTETRTNEDGWLHGLHIQDHIKGLKIEFENYEGKWQKIFDESTLPLGEKILQINILTDLLKGRTARTDGATIIPDKGIGAEVKRQTPQPAAPTIPKAPLPAVPAAPIAMDTRTDNGRPTTINAPLFASENLLLNKENEKFRQAIIESAKRYNLTPHALAAIINAEAAKTKTGGWIETCSAGGSSARGLGQFLPPAWFEYVAKTGTLGNAEALKQTGATKLAAENGKLYKVDGKEKTEISGFKVNAILSWRDNGGYSIDAIGSYAVDNLARLKDKGIDATTLPPDEQVKIAYILHHEGPTDGPIYLRGELQKLEDFRNGTIAAKLASQFKNKAKHDDGTAKAKALADRFGGDYVKAYYYFLAAHADTKVRTKSFMLKHDGFNERSAYDVIQSVAGIKIEKPKERNLATADSSKRPSNAVEQDKAKEVSPNESVGGVIAWSDPVDQCSIRIGGYNDSVTDPASARAKSLFGGRGGKHKGIDLCATPGTPVKAVANSVIHFAGNGGSYGNVIVLKVDINDLPPQQKQYAEKNLPPSHNIIYFMYAHLSEINVKRNGPYAPSVHAGQIIGKSGATGNAKGMTEVGYDSSLKCGAHLHFEVRRSDSLKKGQGQWFDPKPFLQHCN
jgi:murein DD-endopeptidase MepM/ murein hydrolase activator NlpD